MMQVYGHYSCYNSLEQLDFLYVFVCARYLDYVFHTPTFCAYKYSAVYRLGTERA